jgi:hypothetical protein
MTGPPASPQMPAIRTTSSRRDSALACCRGLLGFLSVSPPLSASRVTAGRRHGR